MVTLMRLPYLRIGKKWVGNKLLSTIVLFTYPPFLFSLPLNVSNGT